MILEVPPYIGLIGHVTQEDMSKLHVGKVEEPCAIIARVEF